LAPNHFDFGAISESGAGVAVHTEHGANVASVGLFDVFHFVGVHTNQTGDLEAFRALSVFNPLSSLQSALVHSHVRQLPKGLLVQLKRICYHWLRRVAGQVN